MEETIISETNISEPRYEVAVQITPLSILKRLESLGMNQEEFVRAVKQVGELYFKRGYQIASRTRHAIQKPNIKDIRRQAVIMGVLAVSAAEELKKTVGHKGAESISVISDADQAIKTVTGISALETWLNKKGKDRLSILESSGKKGTIETLLELRINPETLWHYETIDRLRRLVSELFDWLQVVAALNKNAATRPRLRNLAYTLESSQESVWNRERTYLTLLIGMTFETDRISFSLDQLSRFSQKIKTKDWQKKIVEQLKLIVIDEETKQTLYGNHGVKLILDNLKERSNQTPFYFAKKVHLDNDHDRQLLQRSENTITTAIVTSARGHFFPDNQILSDTALKQQIKSTLGGRAVRISYEFLLKYPYFVYWLGDLEILRLASLDIKNRSLAKAVASYDKEKRLKKMFGTLSQKVTVAEVVEQIITGKNLFNQPFEFFTGNRAYSAGKHQRNKLSKKSDHEIYKILLTKILTTLTPQAFCRWAKQLEKNGVKLNLDDLTLSRIVACYFAVRPNERPKCVEERVQKEYWLKHIDDRAILYFRKKVSAQINGITGNKKITDYPIHT